MTIRKNDQLKVGENIIRKSIVSIFLIILFSGCTFQVDTSDPKALLKGYYDALNEKDIDLLKQVRHSNFITAKTIRKFQGSEKFSRGGTKVTYSSISIVGKPKLHQLEDSGFKYKLFNYRIREGLAFESLKTYNKFMREEYPRLEYSEDIEGLKNEGWVQGVSSLQNRQGMAFWSIIDEKWYFCDVNKFDIARLNGIIPEKDYKYLKTKLKIKNWWSR